MKYIVSASVSVKLKRISEMITLCFIYALHSAPPSLETRFYAVGSATNQTEPVMGLGHDWCGC